VSPDSMYEQFEISCCIRGLRETGKWFEHLTDIVAAQQFPHTPQRRLLIDHDVMPTNDRDPSQQCLRLNIHWDRCES
jgi:hypothetical protein